MTIEIVDPAWEIAGVIRQLLTRQPSNEQTWQIIQQALGAKISPSEHWELMSVLNSRLLRLDMLVRSIRDRELGEPERTRIVQAVNQFAHVLRPEQQVQAWSHTLQHHLKADDALHLMWFSIIAKRYQPLRKVTDDERVELIAKIDETLTTLAGAPDIPDWAKLPLSEGLRRLRFMLQHLLFFGCEAAIDQILNIYNKASAVEEALGPVHGPTTQGNSKSSTLLAVLSLVVLAANTFWLPDQATTAFERYQGWYLKMVVENPRLPKPKTLLLAAPTPDEPQAPARQPTESLIEPKPTAEDVETRD
jgi:hypothetical protein